jgi:hypothetical protein
MTIKFLLTIFLVCLHQLALGQPYSRIDLTGNPKAKGLSIAVKYPTGWEVNDGERPNIVKKFSYNYSDYMALLMVQVKNVPKEALPEIKSFTLRDWQEVLSEIGAVSNSSTLSLEGQKVYVSDISLKLDRMNSSFIQKYRVAGLFYRDKWIWLWCGVGANASMSMSQVDSRFRTITPICYQFFNSLVLLDRY